MKQILDILNPVHEPSVSEWMQIAAIIVSNNISTRRVVLDIEAIQLMQRWEELTRGKWVEKGICSPEIKDGYDTDKIFQPALLTKEMFVNSVEKPLSLNSVKYKWGKNIGLPREDLKKGHIQEYQAAQSEVLFEGFEMDGSFVLNPSNVCVGFGENYADVSMGVDVPENKYVLLKMPTLSDFLTEITRYNRTATKTIEIKWTPNVIKKLLA